MKKFDPNTSLEILDIKSLEHARTLTRSIEYGRLWEINSYLSSQEIHHVLFITMFTGDSQWSLFIHISTQSIRSHSTFTYYILHVLFKHYSLPIYARSTKRLSSLQFFWQIFSYALLLPLCSCYIINFEAISLITHTIGTNNWDSRCAIFFSLLLLCPPGSEYTPEHHDYMFLISLRTSLGKHYRLSTMNYVIFSSILLSQVVKGKKVKLSPCLTN
jgi:hypothetical protein